MEVRRGYKRSTLDEVNHSRLARGAVMTQLIRVMNDRSVAEIVQDLRHHLNRASEVLEEIEEGERPLHVKLFDLDLHVVSPLYCRLRRHLIDWGERRNHPELSYQERKKFNEADGESV